MTPRWRRAAAIAGAIAAALSAACADGTPAAEARRAADPAPAVLTTARQLLVVTTPDWDTVQGELQRYERATTDAAWQPVGSRVTIVVGRSGTAWDPALTPVVPGPVKREGDGRSPAGAFALGSAFGLATPAEAAWLKLPYIQEVPTLECVDDVTSAHYNRLVDRSTMPAMDWKSSEKMAEVGEAYRWGVVVDYNTSPPTPGHGSCIFLHVSPTPGRGTAGCTAMAAPVLDDVLRWLDPARRPALVQLPAAARAALTAAWTLPGPDGVDAAVQEFLTAFNALDLPRLLATFAEDAVMFHPPAAPPRTFPVRVAGRAEIERTFGVVFDQIRAASGRTSPPFQDIRPQDVLIQRFDGAAVVTFHLGTEQVRGRRTLVLQRTGETWRIVHLHASTFPAAPPG